MHLILVGFLRQIGMTRLPGSGPVTFELVLEVQFLKLSQVHVYLPYGQSESKTDKSKYKILTKLKLLLPTRGRD